MNQTSFVCGNRFGHCYLSQWYNGWHALLKCARSWDLLRLCHKNKYYKIAAVLIRAKSLVDSEWG